MKNAGQADKIVQDQTTMYVINLSEIECVTVDFVNLFPSIGCPFFVAVNI